MNDLKQIALNIWIESQKISDLIAKLDSPGFYLGVYEYMHYTGDKSYVIGYGKSKEAMMDDISEKYGKLYKVQKYPPLEVVVLEINSEDFKTVFEIYLKSIQHKIDISRKYCVIFKYDSEICGVGKTFEDALRMAEEKFPQYPFPQNPESYCEYISANPGDLCIVSDVRWDSYNKLTENLQKHRIRRAELSDSCKVFPWEDLVVDTIN